MIRSARIVAPLCVFVTLSGGPARADEQTPASSPAGEVSSDAGGTLGLTPVDWTIIAVYALSTIILGWHFGRRQRTMEEYFVGRGNMNWLLIGVSLFATLLSTISYLSMPGEVVGKGPAHLTYMLGLPIVYVVVGYLLLPVYMRQRVTSAYELLESRLGLSVRLLGVVMFLTLRLVWMSLLVYLAAKAMAVMSGIDEQWIPAIVLVMGFVAVTYTSLGGLQAVVITDLVQTLLLFGGALLVVAMITIDFGGFGWFPSRWQADWDTQPIFSFDPATRVTVVGAILSMLTWYVCTAGGDQVSVQRFMATRDARAARRALATQLTVSAVVGITLGIVGFALLAYFQAHPGELPAGMGLKQDADDVFPRYISYHLPVGVSGVVVAAMLAAAMSSIDSGVNSITAVVATDLLDRFGRRPWTERGQLRVAKLLAFAIGGVVVTFSSLMEHVPGNITEVTSKTVNLLVTPIFCLFFFALFVPFARPAGVWFGWFCGLTTAVLIAFSGPLFGFDPVTGYDPVSFLWIGPAALAANMIAGALASLALPNRPGKA